MAAEEDFVLSFTGEETDNLLKHTESMKNQTTEEDGETVQVYDTNGVPHKVSKTELLKKSTLALPALEDISSFVAINAAGNAVGLMTKEQVASVLAGLIQFPFAYRGRKVVDANNIEDGYYYAENGSTNTNGYFGFLLSAKSDQSAFQILVEVFTGTPYQRAKISNGQWTEWKEL
ncbi:pyocin knob domain-containing protein [Phocaeicola sp.]|uniref:pyocin knob domain-containing protein n=1 Tax=Phocaeicola sp. TaxID=2773926 RepID=UPI003AB21F1D